MLNACEETNNVKPLVLTNKLKMYHLLTLTSEKRRLNVL
jgi:hypothetical protein